ncbi:3'-5' exonuclease [Sphaerisporangium sp. NPDC004334]
MGADPVGYAVLDLETTGLRPSRHRVVEIGVVHLAPSGRFTGQWCTLLDPGRDLGPRSVHGLTAADVRDAPAFGDIAGTLTGLLRGRVPVAHNLRFDLAFLRREFDRLGAALPRLDRIGVCTMAEAARLLAYAPRSLAACCAAAGVRLERRHDALADARATAGLLQYYLDVTAPAPPWHGRLAEAAVTCWPAVSGTAPPRARPGAARHGSGASDR